MLSGIIMPRNHLVGKLPIGRINVKIPVLFKEVGIFKFMEIREHRAVLHIMAVNNSYPVG